MFKNEMSTAMSSFLSPELTRTASEVSAVFEAHSMKHDSVSQDIKSLEAYLRSIVTTPFRFYVEKPNGVEPSEFYVSWEKAENGSMRLMYEEFDFDKEAYSAAGEDADYREFEEVLGKKPLIEARLAVRLALAPFLPRFLQAFAEKIEKILSRKVD